MKKLLIALLFLTTPVVAHDKLQVLVQPNPDNFSVGIQDSTRDITKKFKSKTMELTTNLEEADIIVTVVGRFFMPTGDYHITLQNLGSYSTAQIREGVKATVIIMVEIPQLGKTRMFKGQHWMNKWGNASRDSWKNAAKWIESL